MVESDACIGDVWQWGEAHLQINTPRGPCYKLGIPHGEAGAAYRDSRRDAGRLVSPFSHTGTRSDARRHTHRVATPRAGLGRTSAESVNNRTTAYPDIAELVPLTPSVARLLTVRHRDIFGGVPESD